MDAEMSSSELAARARVAYDAVREKLETTHDGEFVAMNLDTSEYEVGPEVLAASNRAKMRFPNGPLFVMRMGRRAAYRLRLGLAGRIDSVGPPGPRQLVRQGTHPTS